MIKCVEKYITEDSSCSCGCNICSFVDYGCDGGMETWVIAACTLCGTTRELWDGSYKILELSENEATSLAAQLINSLPTTYLDKLKVTKELKVELIKLLASNVKPKTRAEKYREEVKNRRAVRGVQQDKHSDVYGVLSKE